MKKNNKKILWSVGLIIIVILVLLNLFSDNIEISKIEKILPELKNMGLNGYFDNGKCKFLEYKDRKVKEGCEDRDYPGKDFMEFTLEDKNILNQAKEITSNKFLSVGLNYSNGQIIKATFNRDCSFCGTTYVYSPNYVLPNDIPGEREYHKINQNWYRIQQDPL